METETAAKSCLPPEVLVIIANYYEQLVYSMARKIQYFYAKYKKWVCEDCGRVRLRHSLVEAHACDDWKGCCYKRVCADECIYQCDNGHMNVVKCETHFCDPFPFNDDPYTIFDYERHKLYSSHSRPCDECGGLVLVHRRFDFDAFYGLRCRYMYGY